MKKLNLETIKNIAFIIFIIVCTFKIASTITDENLRSQLELCDAEMTVMQQVNHKQQYDNCMNRINTTFHGYDTSPEVCDFIIYNQSL